MTQATIEKNEVIGSAPVAKKVKGLWRALCEFCMFLIIGLLLLELICKSAGVCDEENYLVDKKVGWVPVPNRTATYRTEGYSRYKINSLGMRDKERTIAKPPNTFRIAVLGCSVTEGKEVFVDQTYCSLLEKQLNQQGGPQKYEVLNFAVAAYSLGQEYLRLKHFAMQFKPDLVIFTVRPNALLFMGSNSQCGLFSSAPLFGVLPNGTLVEDHNFQNYWLNTAEGKRAQRNLWLGSNSSLYALLGKCAYNLNDYMKSFGKPGTRVFKNDAEKNVQLKQNINTALTYLSKVASALVAQAKAICNKEGSEFLVLYLPAKSTSRYGLEAKLVEDFCRQQNVNYADCNPDFDQIQKTSDKWLYCIVHPSKFGHEKIAEFLKSRLASGGFLKPGISALQSDEK